jgi:hypothetical protein
MTRITLTLTLLAWPLLARSDPPPVINFNLVQVNHYHGQEKTADSILTPGAHVVIDVGGSLATQKFVAGSAPVADLAPVTVNIERIAVDDSGGVTIPWETQTVLRTASGGDSFLVSASRTGCPGTEVRPSVAVAFATPHGWSNPPIRFGPLSQRGLCPLGRGVQLQVSAHGDDPPLVKLREELAVYDHR